MKPVVKTRRSETINFAIKRFRFFHKVKRINRRRMEESEDEADVECLYCAGLLCEDHDGEHWVCRISCLE